MLSVLVALTFYLASPVVSYPQLDMRSSSNSGGRLIVPPPPAKNTGLKHIPDAAHPYQAPGPNDQRGPCPGLNTMANHGYIPRNGIASFEQIVDAAQEAFNMDYPLVSAIAAFGMLARGNSFIDRISIGGPVPEIPALPGNIDGKQVLGLATHGRFEGDVSMTRQDAAIGDNRNFQVDLYDELLETVGQFGDDSPVTGNRSVVTTAVMSEFKYRRFIEDQAKNPELQYHEPRFSLSYGEAGFTLNFFANGTDGILSVPTMGSFFRNQTFPQNWHRRSSPGTLQVISDSVGEFLTAHPLQTGSNNAQGVFVPDNNTDPCSLYDGVVKNNIPASLVNTTGLFKKNVDTLLDAIFNLLGGDGCPQVLPGGPVGV